MDGGGMICRRRLAAVLVYATLLAAPLAQAWADHDDEKAAAEAALARGDARPVHELLQRVRSKFAGSVLKVELEHEDDGDALWVYEVKLLTLEGDVLELAYDAATLELIGLEGRHREQEDDD
jgi:uncharacterized membrane protein YkoI